MENSIKQIKLECQVVHFEMVGKRPTEQEANNLLNFSHCKKPLNKEEIKDKMRNFGKMIGYSILMILGGGFLFLCATGMEQGGGKGLFYLGGIAGILIGIGFFVASFIKPFMSEMQKTPEKSLLAWLSSIMGEDQFFDKNKDRNIEHRIYVLDRMLPDNININEDETNQYITHIREKITIAIDEITNKVRETYPQLKPAYIGKEVKIESVTMLFPNVAEVCSIVKIEDILEEVISEIEKKSRFHRPAIVKLHIKQYIIKTDKFCYPYDVMPEICIQA